MQNNNSKENNLVDRLHTLGWVLFIICAIFFMAAGLKNNDMLTFIGSIVFLLACIIFLIPLLKPKNKY